ncbi:MAG: hypothetical protein GY757_36985, partial [bacterium]|nr:hypothetical protein [bacterium]
MVTLFSPLERPVEELLFALWRCYPESRRPAVKELKKDLYDWVSHEPDSLHLMAREILEG